MISRWVDLRHDGKIIGKAQIEFEEGQTNYRVTETKIEDPEASKELFSTDYSQFSVSTKETFGLDKENT